jgi:DNA-binding transcriptional LysR family regulator
MRSLEQGSSAGARWQSIEVRHLAALAAVAQTSSFRRAADRLGYVQSAISGQIAQLERATGARLLVRASGTPTVELTDAGRVLLSHTAEIMARLEQAYIGVSSLAARSAASVRIAGLEQFEPRRLARILRTFRERHPSARIALEESASDELSLELLAEGTLDLVVTDQLPSDGPFGHVVLEHDPYVLLVAADCELARREEPPEAAELASLAPIVPAPGRASVELRASLRELGIEERTALSLNSVATTQALVGSGLGVAIIRRHQVDSTDPTTAVVELPGLLPEREVVVAFHAERDHIPAVYGLVRAASLVCKLQPAHSGAAYEKLRSVPQLVPDAAGSEPHDVCPAAAYPQTSKTRSADPALA